MSKAGLDQFFTPASTARACWDWLKAREEFDAAAHFIEPSCGPGAFLSLMPPAQRTGVEIDIAVGEKSCGPTIVGEDFLSLRVEQLMARRDAPIWLVGNPPFGYRGKDALAFINHGFALGAAYIAFILPPAFRPRMNSQPSATCDSFVEVKRIIVTGCKGDCGQQWIGKCDMYIGSAGYGSINVSRSFEDIQRNGYGIIIKREKEAVEKFILENDWPASAATSIAKQQWLSIDCIKRAIIEGGFIDEGTGGGAADIEPPVSEPPMEKRIRGGHSIGFLDVPTAFELPEGEDRPSKEIGGVAFVLYKAGPRPGARGPLFGNEAPSCDRYARFYSIDHHKSRDEIERAKIDRCRIFIPCATRHGMKKDCRATPEPGRMNCTGIELLPSGKQDELAAWLYQYDWMAAGKRSSNRNILIGQDVIRAAIIEGGFVDGKPAAYDLYSIGVAHKKEGTSKWGLDKIRRCSRFLPTARRHGQAAEAMKEYQPGWTMIGIETEDAELLRFIDEADWAKVSRLSTNRNLTLTLYMVREHLDGRR